MTVTRCSPQFYLYDGPTKPKPVVSVKEGGQQSGNIVISLTDRISFISYRASIQIYKKSFSCFSFHTIAIRKWHYIAGKYFGR